MCVCIRGMGWVVLIENSFGHEVKHQPRDASEAKLIGCIHLQADARVHLNTISSKEPTNPMPGMRRTHAQAPAKRSSSAPLLQRWHRSACLLPVGACVQPLPCWARYSSDTIVWAYSSNTIVGAYRSDTTLSTGIFAQALGCKANGSKLKGSFTLFS
jgi:hypothetical protein